MKGIRFGLGVAAAAAAVAVGVTLLASTVLAATGTVSISSGSAEPGGEGSVTLDALDVTDPGLGAWTVDITYDPDVISVADCAPEQGGVCNPEFTADSIRITGASATGLDGDTTLGTITFECGDEEADSDLTLSVEVFADATIGDPQPIDADVEDGSFECAVQPTEVPPTATLPARGVAEVGTGLAGSDGGNLTWVIAALAGAGLATILGISALRFRSRRS